MPSIQEQLLASILRGDQEVKNRENLGAMVPIQLFQALRLVGVGSAIQDMVGDGADALVYRSGQSLGEILGNAVLPQADSDLGKYVGLIRAVCLKLSIGQVVVEKVALHDNLIQLRVDECVSCAGLESADKPICHFEAGMVGGIVRTFTKTPVRAIETRCNAIGDGTCGIDVHILNRA
jgi:predicted hydrocarbon binding protein